MATQFIQPTPFPVVPDFVRSGMGPSERIVPVKIEPTKDISVETLSAASLSESLNGLVERNYQMRLTPQLENLHNLNLVKQAEANALIVSWAKTQKLDNTQRKFLFELAAATAPAAVAIEVDKDYLLSSGAFRKKNEEYNPNNNNCRQYGFKHYYWALEGLLDLQLVKVLGSKSHGRPSRFDWRSSGLKRCSARDWENMSPEKQEAALTGRPVFISYTFDPKKTDDILNALEPGDLIGLEHNPRMNLKTRTYNPHVGIYAGEGQIIHLGTPIYRDGLEDFFCRTHTVTIYKLARRDMKKIDTSMLLPDQVE